MSATRNEGNRRIDVLELELERFRYSGAPKDALSALSMNLAPGSLTAVVGGSGSGKSTLGAVLAGMLPRHDGDELEATISLGGQRIRHTAGSSLRIDVSGWAGHVGMLPQDAGHYLSGVRETVEEELAFGLENTGIPRTEMRLRVSEVADRLGVWTLLRREPERLSGGQERLVALAALALSGSRVLVLDEPLAGLDGTAAAEVSALVARLRAGGTAIVLLTRSPGGLGSGADHVVSLGGYPGYPPGRTDAGASVPTPSASPSASEPRRPVREAAGTGLEFAGVRLRYPGAPEPVVSGLDLRVDAGECLALVGANGAGKSTILKASAGLLRPEGGRILLAGADVCGPKRSRAGNTAGLLLQNPSDQLFERTVRREVAFGLSRRGAAAERVPEVLARLGLEHAAETHPYELPASARRLVALAAVLVHEPAVLLLDEPTEALDTPGVARLNAAIETVLERGGAVVVATHDEAFTASMAHRVHRLDAAYR